MDVVGEDRSRPLLQLQLAERKNVELQASLDMANQRLILEQQNSARLDALLESKDFFLQLQRKTDFNHFYSGFDSHEKLYHVYRFVAPTMPSRPPTKLTGLQQFILTLVGLRLFLPLQDLAYRFAVSTSTIERNIHDWISAMYLTLVPTVIFWPQQSDVKESLPVCFRGQFDNCIGIIDCFEIFMNRPIKLKKRGSTYSTYKSHNTVKYLICVTPQGSVSFISLGYGGRISDKFIVENSGFLEHVKESGLILADKGFPIHEAVGMRNAQLKPPAFKKTSNNFPHRSK